MAERRRKTEGVRIKKIVKLQKPLMKSTNLALLSFSSIFQMIIFRTVIKAMKEKMMKKIVLKRGVSQEKFLTNNFGSSAPVK
jgi:hypothetical protein